MTDTVPRTEARMRCVVIPRFNMLTLTSMLEPLRLANALAPTPLYRSSFHSVDGDYITSVDGFGIACEPVPERLNRTETVLLFGGPGSMHYHNPRLFSWLRLQMRLGARLCAVDLAPYIAARAGLLNGHRATLHWTSLPGFQEQFPDIQVVEQLYVDDAPVLTAAGGTAGIDLMLHLISQTHGTALVGDVSDRMIHHPVRPSSTGQRITLGRSAGRLPEPVRAAVDLIEAHIAVPLSVPEIATRIGLSPRQLLREFSTATGCSVVQFALLMRLQHARVLLMSTGMGIRDVATATGFNSLSHFANAFRKCFGRRPSDYRPAQTGNEPEPHWPGPLHAFLETNEVRRRIDQQIAGARGH
ncbi:GlxA family transcriptional regulator [Roseovarius pelagicus]|uniref:GlxA family transcriptional regulator n=1 Tax=Roseovarius pelagicus TaxID=2980108 RepID=A0ABY6DD90_9RHOB|nr:GlxA family transcriptional regulator [Roseovarius pelagicus]UXX83829.1 GlxA family transcriptional regulator [Roseovarius pelagicus]